MVHVLRIRCFQNMQMQYWKMILPILEHCWVKSWKQLVSRIQKVLHRLADTEDEEKKVSLVITVVSWLLAILEKKWLLAVTMVWSSFLYLRWVRALNAVNFSHILVRLLQTISEYLTETVSSMLECELDNIVSSEHQEKLEHSEKEGDFINQKKQAAERLVLGAYCFSHLWCCHTYLFRLLSVPLR